MDLYIRSQNKEALLKVNNGLMYWEDTDKRHTIVIKETSTNLSIIGAYTTKERALEVLDEIQDILKPHLIIKNSGKIIGSFEDTIVREGATYELKELSTYVYEMPLD